MNLFPYRLPLTYPLSLPGAPAQTERKGLLLYHPDTGGWGDAAPLPGISPETFDQVIAAAQREDWTDPACPSLRFASWCAQQPWAPPAGKVRCNGLWISATESLEDLLHRLGSWMDPVLKVKPGREPDRAALRRLMDARPGATLRIDGNRQWSVEQTLKLVEELPPDAVEYLEEPLADPEGYEELWSQRRVPIALDESLLLPEGQRLFEQENVVAVILKPTLLGGSNAWRPWVDACATLGKTVVWSSCFESGVGLWNLARLAADGAPAGLDTGFRLSTDLVCPRPIPINGVLENPTKILMKR